MNLQISLKRETEALLRQPNLRLRIGEHVVDVGALRIVTRPDVPRLTSKAVAVLIELVRHAGATVRRDELLDRVWTGRFTTPDVLTQAIKELRRAFADDSKPPNYIETIPKVGYRLIAQVLVLEGPENGIFVEGTSGLSANEDDVYAEDKQSAREMTVSPPSYFSRSSKNWIALAFAVAAIGIASLLFSKQVHVQDSADESTWRVTDLHALTSDPGAEYRPHLSPDSTRVAFSIFGPESQSERLVVRSVEPSQLVRLTDGGVNTEAQPVWSPDGTTIAFERIGVNYCAVFVAPSLGGNESEIGKCQNANYNYFDWTPDGRSLISAERRGAQGDLTLFKWNLDNGEKQDLKYERAGDDQDLDPRYSPNGQWIAFRRGVSPHSNLYVMTAEGGGVRAVTHLSARINGYTWTSDNRTLVFSSNYQGAPSLYAVDVDDGRLQALGISPAQYPDAGKTGDAIVYEITRTQDKLTVLPLNAGSKRRVLAPSTGSDFSPVLSPSGDRLVFASDRSGQLQLWLYDWATGATTQLTERADTAVFSPQWSPDGKRILAMQRNASGRKLIEIELASRRQRVLSRPDEEIRSGTYGPDPETYLFTVGKLDRNAELVQVQHPATLQETRKSLVSGIAYLQVDPATRSVLYTTFEKAGLYRYELDSGGERFVTSKVTTDLFNGWRLVDGRIWYLADLSVRSAVMHEFNPEDGADRVITQFNVLMQDISFSVTPSHDSIIFAPVDVEDTDVGMFRLQRRSSGS
ncbi:MAG: winged helix-turn-helix domain-containing protein [Dokdonella sp.]